MGQPILFTTTTSLRISEFESQIDTASGVATVVATVVSRHSNHLTPPDVFSPSDFISNRLLESYLRTFSATSGSLKTARKIGLLKEMNYRCVQCGHHIKSLYVQYSPGNIRLMKCQNCRAVADEYIECEIMILLIDLILHKAKAYRHLFYNMFDPESMNIERLMWKLTFGFLVLDAYRISILLANNEDSGSNASLASLIWSCGKILLDAVVGNLLFISILLLGTRTFLKMSSEVSRYKNIWLAILASSYLKVFLLAMMVWEFPSSVIFIIDIFVLSSNTLALNVMSESAMVKCFGVCLCAHVVKFLVSLALNVHLANLITL